MGQGHSRVGHCFVKTCSGCKGFGGGVEVDSKQGYCPSWR